MYICIYIYIYIYIFTFFGFSIHYMCDTSIACITSVVILSFIISLVTKNMFQNRCPFLYNGSAFLLSFFCIAQSHRLDFFLC